MENKEITLSLDKRKVEMLERNYEGTIEGYLESQLETLIDEVVPPEEQTAILADINFENDTRSPEKFALVRIADDYDTVYFTSTSANNLVSFAEMFVEDIYSSIERMTPKSLANLFDNAEPISKQAYDILCKAFENEPNIAIMIEINRDDDNVGIREKGDADYKRITPFALKEASNYVLGCNYKTFFDKMDALRTNINSNLIPQDDIEENSAIEM